MFKVTHGKGDLLRVIATRDSLTAAVEEAYAHSQSLDRWMRREDCWVEVRDVKDVVLRRVNHWTERHREPMVGEGKGIFGDDGEGKS